MTDLHTNSPCDSCGGTGISGFELMTDDAVRCKLCKGTGVYSGQDFEESGL